MQSITNQSKIKCNTTTNPVEIVMLLHGMAPILIAPTMILYNHQEAVCPSSCYRTGCSSECQRYIGCHVVIYLGIFQLCDALSITKVVTINR